MLLLAGRASLAALLSLSSLLLLLLLRLRLLTLPLSLPDELLRLR